MDAVISDNDSDKLKHRDDEERGELSCNDGTHCHSFIESNTDQISKTYEA